MPDLVIKPTAGAGNKLILQDQGGGALVTISDNSFALTPSTTPSSPASGQMYFNTTTKLLLIYTGTMWQVVSGPTGGNVGSYVSSGTTYYYHTFLNSARFTCPATITCDFLIIAGGGSGGAANTSDSKAGHGGDGGSGIVVIKYAI